MDPLLTDRSQLLERLSKLLALARRGVGGEKTNAQVTLDRLLAKHDITLAELERSERTRHVFKYRGGKKGHDAQLLVNVICRVLNSATISIRRGRGYYAVETTAAEAVEITLLHDVYRRALARETDRLLHAFIVKNEIYPSRSDDDDTPSSLSDEDLGAILRMMRTLDPTPLPRGAIGA